MKFINLEIQSRSRKAFHFHLKFSEWLESNRITPGIVVAHGDDTVQIHPEVIADL